MHPIALHPSTVLAAGQVGAVQAAAAAGFPLVGVRLGPAFPGDPTPEADLPALRRALAGSGVRVLDVEVFRLRAETVPAEAAGFLDAAATLEAAFVTVAGHDPDPGRLAANLNAVAELAAARGLRVALEFMAFSAVPTARAAGELVALAGHPGLGILVDPLHLYRGGGDARDLAGLPLLAAQLCDAPAAAPADLAAEARGARLMPGEGGLDLTTFLAALPEGLPISLEVTNRVVEDPIARALRGRAALARFEL